LNPRRVSLAALVGCVLLCLPACAPEGADLGGATWVLDIPEEWGTTPVGLTPTLVTLEFLPKEGAVRGAFAYQEYSGDYVVDGNAISFSRLGWATYSCPTTGGTVPREQAFMFALGDAQSYVVQGDVLTIDCGELVLEFTRQQTT
jgi:heat shock protein HslJ